MEADGNEMTDACSDFCQAWARAGSSLALKDMTGFLHMVLEQRGSSRRSHKGLIGGEAEAEVPIVGGKRDWSPCCMEGHVRYREGGTRQGYLVTHLSLWSG